MPRRPLSLLALASVCLSLSCPVAPAQAPTSVPIVGPVASADSGTDAWQHEQPVRAQHAMVVSVHHLATDAGVQILRSGGNAVDAAVATGFALAVVHPIAGNLGGGGFMLLHQRTGKDVFLDFREEAPLAASADMYLDAHGNLIPAASTLGYRAIGTPGSVAGLIYAQKKYGKLTVAQVMAPAIALTAEGFALTVEEAAELEDTDLARDPESHRIFQRAGRFYKSGERFAQPELALTLRRIAADPEDFYHGAIAKKLAADVQAHGGILTVADLAHYQVKERAPVTGNYDGYTVVSAPQPSAGGIALIESLNILRGYDLARLGDRTAAEVHLITEAFRRAYMDRTDYLGDPDFATVPVAQLTSQSYANAWRRSIRPDAATPSKELQRPAGFLPPPPAPNVPGAQRNNTTHYSVVDAEGNAVSVTTTLNNAFGAHVTAEGLGFLLNDEMDDFAAKQGAPNMYGLIQGPNNAIAPGKRPLSAMTPTIILKDGKVRMVLGSPGGPRITTTVTNVFLSVAEGGLNIQQAVDAPRFHHQYLPDVLYLEADFPPAAVAGLRAMHYQLDEHDHWSDAECIAVDPKTGMLEGGQDHRHHFGKAAGY